MRKMYQFTAVVNFNGKTYLVDSCDTFDCGYELMVFKINKHYPDAIEKRYGCDTIGKINALVHDDVDFSDLYVRHYASIEEAEEHFDKVVKDFASVVSEFEEDEPPTRDALLKQIEEIDKCINELIKQSAELKKML